MRRVLLLSLVVLAGCHRGPAGDSPMVKKAEALVRQQAKAGAIKFDHVQSVGDSQTGTTCGYFTRTNVLGGTDVVRFMVFADGNDGANPYIDEAAAPFPQKKTDFAPAWKKQCVTAGYTVPHAADESAKKKT